MTEQQDQSLGQRIEQIQKLLEQNLQATAEIQQGMKVFKRWIIWQWVGTAIKFLVIVLPLAIGAFYLWPLLNQTLNTYQELLNLSPSQGLIQQLNQLKK